MLLVPYLRVSTDDTQSVDSSGQLHAITVWAGPREHTLASPFADDGLSGALGPDKRPGLAQALAACTGRRRGKPQGIVAYDRTRLCRDAALAGHLAWLARANKFVLLTTDGYDSSDSSDTALIMGAFGGAFGELQRRAIGASTKKALAARKARGQAIGHTPFGWRRDGKAKELLRDEVEQEALKRLRALAEAVGPNSGELARRLNAEGLTMRAGKPWTKGCVYYLLRNQA